MLAIGNFDGLHLGHQAILRATVDHALEIKAVATALTFDPPPLKVLRPESAPPRVSTNTQRIAGFSMMGVEAAVVMPFTMELARLAPEGFVEQILVRDLRVAAILVGENFRFGHRQSGNVKLLRELGQRLGFEVVIIPPVVYRGEIVSSTIIRREIAARRCELRGAAAGASIYADWRRGERHRNRQPVYFSHAEPGARTGVAACGRRVHYPHEFSWRLGKPPVGDECRHAPHI